MVLHLEGHYPRTFPARYGLYFGGLEAAVGAHLSTALPPARSLFKVIGDREPLALSSCPALPPAIRTFLLIPYPSPTSLPSPVSRLYGGRLLLGPWQARLEGTGPWWVERAEPGAGVRGWTSSPESDHLSVLICGDIRYLYLPCWFLQTASLATRVASVGVLSVFANI